MFKNNKNNNTLILKIYDLKCANLLKFFLSKFAHFKLYKSGIKQICTFDL